MNQYQISDLKNTFHEYKDPLMKNYRRKDLPQQYEVMDEAHHDLFASALQHHPNAATKIGCGIDSFFARRSLATFGDKTEEVCCMYVRRLDGTEEDFSIFACIGKESWKSDGTRAFDATTGKLVKRVT